MRPYIEALIKLILKSGLEPLLDKQTGSYFAEGEAPWPVLSDEELASRADVAVVLGGDGTMLSAARRLWPHDIPIIGINAGRLGFITDIVLEDMPRILPMMLAGHCQTDRRHLLFGRIFRGGEEIFSSVAVNDIGISHGRALGMAENADRIERAVEAVLASGLRTGDIMSEGCRKVSCSEMGDAVRDALK